MAVDEEEDEEEERNSLGSDRDSPPSYHNEQSPFREEEAISNPYQTFTQAEIQQQVWLCVSQRTDHLFVESSSLRADLCKRKEPWLNDLEEERGKLVELSQYQTGIFVTNVSCGRSVHSDPSFWDDSTCKSICDHQQCNVGQFGTLLSQWTTVQCVLHSFLY